MNPKQTTRGPIFQRQKDTGRRHPTVDTRNSSVENISADTVLRVEMCWDENPNRRDVCGSFKYAEHMSKRCALEVGNSNKKLWELTIGG